MTTELYRPHQTITPPPPSNMEKFGEDYRGFYIIRDPQHSIYSIKTIDYLEPPLGLRSAFTKVILAKAHIDNWLENQEKKKSD